MSRLSQGRMTSDWHKEAKQLLRAEMVRRGLSIEQLAQQLGSMGYPESPKSLAVKVSRGRFQLAFFLQCMTAMDVDSITIEPPRISREPG
jgi:Domain of unknown function (DUF6471)